MPVNLTKCVHDKCTLPVLTHGYENLTKNEFIEDKLRTAQRVMKSTILGFTVWKVNQRSTTSLTEY